MLSKKTLLKNSKLYLILDRQVNSYDELFEIFKKGFRAGIKIFQIRDKFGSAKEIEKFSKKAIVISKDRVLFIVNDRVDLALISRSSGVHLGQDDLSLTDARKLMGSKAIIGVSCQTMKQALSAEKNGANYIGFGSVFKTKTKPLRDSMNLDLLKRIYKRIKIPVFAIGGISLKNIEKLRLLGVDRVAVCRDICLSENIEKVILNFNDAK